MKRVLVVALAVSLIITPAYGAPVRPEFPYPSDIVLAGRILEYETGGAFCGGVYARTLILYKSYPTRAPGCIHPRVFSFAGWRISKLPPGVVAPCYTHADCVRHNPGNEDTARWYPGHRLSESETTVVGQDIKGQTKKCPAGGGGPLPSDTIRGILVTDPCDTNTDCIRAGYMRLFNVYGFDIDDPDGMGPYAPVPAQAVTADLPCGLPYKLVALTFMDENGKPNRLRVRLFKMVVFEQWFGLYWRYNYATGRYDSAVLQQFRQFSAIPPFPPYDDIAFDRRISGRGILKRADVVGIAQRPLRVLLEGNYTLDEGLSGEGLIYVKGDLTVRGPLQYRGTLIVQGTLTLMPERRIHPEPPDRRAPPD